MPFHLIAQHLTWIMVLSTVVPTSFAGVDFLTKQDSGLLLGIFQYCCQKEKQRETPDILPFLFLIAQNITGIVVLSTVVTTFFAGVDSFDKMRFRFIVRNISISLPEKETGGRGDVLPFHLIAQHKTEVMVLSTVVPTSFVGVDSVDKMRFRFISGHFPILLPERETGGEG